MDDKLFSFIKSSTSNAVTQKQSPESGASGQMEIHGTSITNVLAQSRSSTSKEPLPEMGSVTYMNIKGSYSHLPTVQGVSGNQTSKPTVKRQRLRASKPTNSLMVVKS